MSVQEQLSRTLSFQPVLSQTISSDDGPQHMEGVPPTQVVSDPAKSPRELPQPPSKPQALSSTSPDAVKPLARTGTLTWQQRPSSRGSAGPRTRPMSMFAPESKVAKPQHQEVESDSPSGGSMSRSQIAQSLGLRDSSWFKQTHERGVGSAAFRKNQVEDMSDTASTTSSLRLPGMSRESTAEPEIRSSAPSREGSVRGSGGSGYRFTGSASTLSENGAHSPLPTKSSQRFGPPSSDTVSTSGDDASSFSRMLAMSPSQGRISPERPDRAASPTKGLGGFVQSAMLKRSDSVNKRWSAQAGPGLSRGNSTASNLSGYGGSRYPLGGITPLMETKTNSISREGSPQSNSRPTSSHNYATTAPRLSENDRPSPSIFLTGTQSGIQSHEVSTKPTPQDGEPSTPPEDVASPPVSPSKRWSPTKSSWLENAINKPGSSVIKAPTSQQPTWMTEISRAKQNKGSVDMGKGSVFKEVSIGGLVRSPPPGAAHKAPTIGGFPSGVNGGVATKPPNSIIADKINRSASPDAMVSKDTHPTTNSKDAPSPAQSTNVDALSTDKEDVPTKAKPTISPKSNVLASHPGPRSRSSPSTKHKPETPPKKDFQSSLKPRRTSGGKNTEQEPEFKSVFGNLKRAQTKNYVAPDELKNNIMRGKAGLAQTGGPKKTERKDEFKESILQKKQGMVVPSASTRITSASSAVQDQSIPEAISKRRGLARSQSIQDKNAVEGDRKVSKPEALATLSHLRDQPKPPALGNQSGTPVSSQTPKNSNPTGSSTGNFTASLSGMLQRGPSPMVAKPTVVAPSDKVDSQVRPTLSEQEESSGTQQLTHATKSRARGPKRRLPTTGKQNLSTDVPQAESGAQLKPSISESEELLVSSTTRPQSSSPNHVKSELRPLSNITHNNTKTRKPSQPLSPRKPSTTIASPPNTIKSSLPTTQVADKVASPKSPPHTKQRQVSSPKGPGANPSFVSAPTTSPASLPKQSCPEPGPHLSKLVTEEKKSDSQPPDSDAPFSSVRGAAAQWGHSSEPPQPNRARSPVRLPTRKDEDEAVEQAGLKTREPASFDTKPRLDESQTIKNGLSPSQAAQPPKPGPVVGKKPSSIANRVTSTSLPSPVRKQPQLPKPLHPTLFFAEIFDESPSSKQKISIDTQAVLDSCSSKNDSTKIKTLRKQIFEVSENGKSVPVPTHQEHILFDRSIYLCSHVFGNHTGQRTSEVYLWCGDAAPASAIEDAQLFAKKFAKDKGGKLVVLKQGKETTNFFQALGGIVITRRGSSNMAEATTGSGATYILCGRQHVGQMAFDEVDYSRQSLCKGFPYIISAYGGKLYLWKGSGSGADELGCARLIGMDLGLTGEIEEIDEGHEPDAFWEAFQGNRQDDVRKQRGTVQHWRLKPSCEHYTTKLFNVNFEIQRPKSASGFIQGAMQWGRRGSAPANDADTAKTASVKEVVPFAQSDLVDDGVFVLDSFFELFV